jgi:hypothetical protein
VTGIYRSKINVDLRSKHHGFLQCEDGYEQNWRIKKRSFIETQRKKKRRKLSPLFCMVHTK